jgi:hypothetical protein
VLWELLGQNFIPCGTAVFRRSCLERVGLLDQSLAGIDDWDLWVRIAELYSIMALAEPVMCWRRSTPSSRQGTSAANRIVRQSIQQFQQSWKNLPRVLSASHKMKRRAWRSFSANMSAHLSFEVLRALRQRQLIQATKNLFALLRLNPAAMLRLVRINNAHSAL